MIAKLSRSQVLSWRLNKHRLSIRSRRDELCTVVSDICGVQAQVMSGAEMAIWARVDGVTARNVQDALWKDRQLVKTWCMRGTLHILTASDLPVYIAALKTRTLYRTRSWLKFHKISIEEIDKITAATRDALDGRCLSREELVSEIARRASLRKWVVKEMSSGWGSLLHPAAYQGNLCFGPSRGKNVTFVRPDQWLGKWGEPSSEEALRILLQHFVSCYGPCTREDFGHWWGILEHNARRVFQSVIEELQEVEFEGRKAWLRPEDVEQIRSTREVMSLRLLPSFDPYVMFCSPRETLVEQKHRPQVFRQLAGWVSPVLLIDGVAAGIWNYKRRSGRIQITVEPFRVLNRHERRLVEEETARLGEFLETTTNVSLAT